MSDRYELAKDLTLRSTMILRDIEIPEIAPSGTEPGFGWVMTRFPWVAVLSQDCDLDWDRQARGVGTAHGAPTVAAHKKLRAVLLGATYLAEEVLAGTYIDGATAWTGTRKNIILGNREDRYHYLPGEIAEALIVDFKLLISCPAWYLEMWLNAHPSSAVAYLKSPFRERLLQRFTNFVGRVAEPGDEF